MRRSTRSRRWNSTIVPSAIFTRLIATASPLASVEDAAGAAVGLIVGSRSRRSGTYTVGWVTMSSVTSGRPAHTLASVTSACTLPMVTRLVVPVTSGGSSVMSCSVTFSDGHSPILVEPAIVSR